MQKHTLRSFDDRALNVFHTPLSGAKEHVVVALPFGVRHAMADKVYAALAERYNVATWESRFVLDHHADAPDARIDATMHVQDMKEVIDFLLAAHVRPVHVVGYCSGAGIALLGAARYPDAIARLALVSGEFMLPATLCAPGPFQREVDVILPTAASDRDSAQFVYDSIASGRSVEQSEFHGFIALPFSSAEYLYRYGRNYVAYRDNDFPAAAAQVTQPTLILYARQDQHVAPQGSEVLRRHLRQPVASLAVDGDHYEFCRGNRAMLASLTDFLGAA